MRNGNYLWAFAHAWLYFSSYRTYEEWKRPLSLFWWSSLLVLTVPMRNGNSYIIQYQWFYLEFLPYLWGMETTPSSIRNLWLWKEFLPYLWGMETANNLEGVFEFFWVLTVPMRNGNSVRLYLLWIRIQWFLPYLWGMETEVQLRQRT